MPYTMAMFLVLLILKALCVWGPTVAQCHQTPKESIDMITSQPSNRVTWLLISAVFPGEGH